MRRLYSVLFLAVGLLGCAILNGCAGKPPANGPGALNIAQFTLAQGAINVPYMQLLIASGGQQPYTWTITDPSDIPPGLIVATDGIISGTPTAVGVYNFTAKVTDSQIPTMAYDTAPFTITINQDLTLTAVPLANGLVGSAYNSTFSAANGVPPYTYTVVTCQTCGSLPDGLTLSTVQSMNGMANGATITGSPTTAGVYTFTVQATDAASETATANFTITVTGRLAGPYAVTFNGFDTSRPANSQAFYLVGELTASGDMNGMGNINGVIDQSGSSPTSSGGTAVNGTYNIPLNTNFGTISFTRADNNSTYQFDIALSGTTSDSKLIQISPSTQWGSGLLKQQPVTTLAGGASYTFGLFGTDPSGNRYAGAGAFALNTSLAVTGGAEDTNDNGTASGEQFITGGSFTSPDSHGRGTATLMVGSNPVNYAYYVASSASKTELIAVATDSGAPMTLVDVLQQQSVGATGGLVLCASGSMCQGALELDGAAPSGSSTVPEVELGVASFSGCSGSPCVGNFSRSDNLPPYYVDQSVGGTLDSVSYTGGTYSIDATCGMLTTPCGRLTLDLQGPSNQPVWYLVTTGQAFVVGNDSDVLQGSLQPQSPPSGGFGLPNLLGSYLGGSITPVLPSITNEIDVTGTPPPGGIWAQNYETSGPGGPQTGLSLDCTAGTPGCPYVLDTTYGAAFGKFEITDNSSQTISILYLAGGGLVGATGGKAGVVGLNVGVLQSNGSVQPDPNPRLSTYGR